MKALSLDNESRPYDVVALAKTVLSIYSIAAGRTLSVSGDILFFPLKLVMEILLLAFKLIVSVFAIVVLIILTSILIVILCYGNIVFSRQKERMLSDLKKMTTVELINKHLILEGLVRKLQPLKRSKFLFKSPILGSLNQTFFNNILLLEVEAKKLAYPNIDVIPSNLPVHHSDPNDDWQDDLDEYSEEEKFVLN